MFMRILTWWSAWSDSNRQGLRRRILSAVCLAISSHADIYLKPTSCLIAISSISSWMMLSIPIPLLCRTDWPVRPTWHHGLSHDCNPLLCLSHLSYARSQYNDGCSSHSIYYSSCIPQLDVQLITSSVGFVAPSSLHSQLYHTWFYLSSIIFVINIPIAIPAVNEPRQDNRIIISYFHPKYIP